MNVCSVILIILCKGSYKAIARKAFGGKEKSDSCRVVHVRTFSTRAKSQIKFTENDTQLF